MCNKKEMSKLDATPPFANRFLNTNWAVGLTYKIVYIHFFVFWHMQLYMSWYIISFLALSLLLNILYFSSTLVLTSSIDVVFVLSIKVPLTWIFDLDRWLWIFKVKLYVGNGRPDCHGTNKRDGSRYDALMWNTKEMSQQDAVLIGVLSTFTFDLKFSRSNSISGMGGPIVMELKQRESVGCPDVKDNHYVTLRQRLLLGTGVT